MQNLLLRLDKVCNAFDKNIITIYIMRLEKSANAIAGSLTEILGDVVTTIFMIML